MQRHRESYWGNEESESHGMGMSLQQYPWPGYGYCIDQFDQHFNPFAASHHIAAERPENFLLIVAYFNIPPKWVQKQRNVFHTVTSGLVQWRFFLPHTITKGNGKIRYLIPIPDGYAEHDTYKAVSIQVVGIVVCGMAKQFWNIFKFCAKFGYHRIIHAQKYWLRLQWIRYQLQNNPDSGIHKSGIINLCIGTCIIKYIQWFLCYSK